MAAHRRNVALTLSLVALPALAAAGCGGGKAQDAKEPNGSFPIRLISATFPDKQKLAKTSDFQIVVANSGQKTVPNINVTVKCGSALGGSFSTATNNVDVADSRRPQFVVNTIPTATPRHAPPIDPAPLERSSAFVDTYPLGPLAPGRQATFRWNVTAVKAGPYKLCWRVNAGLYGKAKAVASSDSAPLSGTFSGTVSNVAPKASIAPDGHTVIEKTPTH
jgi:hypothetical protein